jgi:hypothetical protein
MRCPKCGKGYVEIHGTFDGTLKIQFRKDGEEFTVIDSEPTDFSWDDHDTVVCLECGYTGTVLEFTGEPDDDDEDDDDVEGSEEEKRWTA